jgi:hypothetical protein
MFAPGIPPIGIDMSSRDLDPQEARARTEDWSAARISELWTPLFGQMVFEGNEWLRYTRCN